MKLTCLPLFYSFSFDACFKMDNDAGTRTGLRLHYTIEEQPYQDRPLPRVRFADSTPNEPSEVHRNITLRPDDMGRFRCSREIVYLLVRSIVSLSIAYDSLLTIFSLLMSHDSLLFSSHNSFLSPFSGRRFVNLTD